MIDEPLVVPVSAGTALVRLAQVQGALKRHPEVAAALPDGLAAGLKSARDRLLKALEGDDRVAVESSFRAAQERLRQVYEALNTAPDARATAGDTGLGDTAPGNNPQPQSGGSAAAGPALRPFSSPIPSLHKPTGAPEREGAVAARLGALGFPPALDLPPQPVDVATVLATFSRPARQVLTTLSFQDAAGAVAYWLREIRILRGERLEDHVVESYAPCFTRLRLAIGTHTFQIESRNASQFCISEEFTVEVPTG